jgi:hypothetical protein
MGEIKTKKNDASVSTFLDAVADEQRRKDAKALEKLLRATTGMKPWMWGTSIVGYGEKPYRTKDGKTNNWPLVAFAPRKQDLTVYIMNGFDSYGAKLKKLGKHKIGKACLYLKRLDEVDTDVLREMVIDSLKVQQAK